MYWSRSSIKGKHSSTSTSNLVVTVCNGSSRGGSKQAKGSGEVHNLIRFRAVLKESQLILWPAAGALQLTIFPGREALQLLFGPTSPLGWARPARVFQTRVRLFWEMWSQWSQSRGPIGSSVGWWWPCASYLNGLSIPFRRPSHWAPSLFFHLLNLAQHRCQRENRDHFIFSSLFVVSGLFFPCLY